MADAFGYTWEYIDEFMTLPRYAAICAHWETTPPLSVTAWVIAQSLGAKPKKPVAAPGKENSAGDRQALLDLFGAAGSGLTQGKPEWLKAATT